MSAGTPLARLRAETNLDIGKGCVRFRRADQLPLDLVREVLVEAAAVNEAQAAASSGEAAERDAEERVTPRRLRESVGAA